ncbi:MAG TPA: hypothetical protein VGL09_07225 [Methylomirabilota bacterium]|jgi:hypothetical protein
MNPWKLIALGMALMMATALATGLVVANWSGIGAPSASLEERPAVAPAPAAKSPAAPVTKPRVPTQAAIASCNREAASTTDKTVEVVRDAAIGAAVGAAAGAGGGAIADGGKGAGKGAAIGGLVGAAGGTLYGLNENRKKDERYREAYASCMRARGYTS